MSIKRDKKYKTRVLTKRIYLLIRVLKLSLKCLKTRNRHIML